MDSILDQQRSVNFTSASTDFLPSKLSKKEKCVKRNSGEAYTTKSGKIVPQRSIKSLESCRRDCKSKITPEDQNKVFTAYWKKGSYDHRFNFVSNLVKLEPKKRDSSRINIRDRQFNANYHLIVNSKLVKVCKKCFLQTLGENYGFVRNVLVKCWTGQDKAPILDGRGKHSPKNKTSTEKIEELENHIRRFPITEHQCPNMHAIKYLPRGFNAMKMYNLYAAEIKEPLSKNMYRKILAQTGLKFQNQTSGFCNECNRSSDSEVSGSFSLINKIEYDKSNDIVLEGGIPSRSLKVTEGQRNFVTQVQINSTTEESVDNSFFETVCSKQGLSKKLKSSSELELDVYRFDLLKNVDQELQEEGSEKIKSEVKDDQSTLIEIEVDPIIISSHIQADHVTEDIESIPDFPPSKTDERIQRSILKNSGEAYVTESGKFIPKRSVKPLDKCKSNCRLTISPEDQKRIFDAYWKGGDYKHRLNFVANLVTLYSPKVRTVSMQKIRKFSVTYHLPNETEKVQVCKKCFLQTLGENDGFIKNVLNKCWNYKFHLESDALDERLKNCHFRIRPVVVKYLC